MATIDGQPAPPPELQPNCSMKTFNHKDENHQGWSFSHKNSEEKVDLTFLFGLQMWNDPYPVLPDDFWLCQQCFLLVFITPSAALNLNSGPCAISVRLYNDVMKWTFLAELHLCWLHINFGPEWHGPLWKNKDFTAVCGLLICCQRLR